MLLNLENDVNELKSQLTFQKLRIEQLVEQLFSLRSELTDSRKECAELYEYNPSAYFTIDNNYRIQALNFQAAYLLGIERNLLINKLFYFQFKDYIARKNSTGFG